jgi:hypothetical protein
MQHIARQVPHKALAFGKSMCGASISLRQKNAAGLHYKKPQIISFAESPQQF